MRLSGATGSAGKFPNAGIYIKVAISVGVLLCQMQIIATATITIRTKCECGKVTISEMLKKCAAGDFKVDSC